MGVIIVNMSKFCCICLENSHNFLEDNFSATSINTSTFGWKLFVKTWMDVGNQSGMQIYTVYS